MKSARRIVQKSPAELWDLQEGNTFIVIDNIPGVLKSAKLEAVLTARYYKGRVLQRSAEGLSDVVE